MSQGTSSHDMTTRLHLWPRGATLTEVKSVVQSLNLPYTVKPFWWEQGVSEDVDRVLVLADGFEGGTVVDYIYPKNPALLREAVGWALGLNESKGARTVQETWAKAFGGPVNIWDDVHMPDWDKEWPDDGWS